MAWRAGASFVDMEMLQFHPTGLLVGDSIATGGLLEEGLRGAGARLYNGLGERYMERYDPAAPGTRHARRYLAVELSRNRGGPRHGRRTASIWTPRHLGEEFLHARISPAWWSAAPTTDSICCTIASKSRPARITRWAACRSTSIAGPIWKDLFVAGEDAGGVHGANRLGGNGVADSIVFGGRAGDAMADYVPWAFALRNHSSSRHTRRVRRVKPARLRSRCARNWRTLMWEKRRRGAERRRISNPPRSHWTRLRERAEMSRMDSLPAWNAALDAGQPHRGRETGRAQRPASHRKPRRALPRGFPAADPAWLKNIVLTPGAELRCEPVQFTRLAPAS